MKPTRLTSHDISVENLKTVETKELDERSSNSFMDEFRLYAFSFVFFSRNLVAL